MEIIVATKNRGKIREIRKALKGKALRVYSLADFENVPTIEEDGKSFVENALKKALFYSKYFGKWTVADDSGLEVDALGGLPGVYSARYSGEGASDRENNQKLLKEMKKIPSSKRKARFTCVMAMVAPDGREAVVEGSCRGKIGTMEVGTRGFGYDPLFILPQYGKTMAQLTVEEKNRVSHRGKALKKLEKMLSALSGQP